MSGESEALAADLLGWDGRRESAEALRERVRATSDPGVRGAAPPGMRALAKAVETYRSKSPGALGTWVGKERNAQEAVALRPLLGDPAMGPWPYEDALAMAEADLVAWSGVFERFRPSVDPAIRRFLRIAFRVRRRQTWPSAARAWAALARDDDGLRTELAEQWTRCFPSVPARWPKTGLGGRQLGPNGPHLVRHTLFLGCSWRARGGDPAVAGLDPLHLASMPLPSDDADRSVVVLALTELDLTAPAFQEPLAKRAKELGDDELSEAAFRELLGVLPPGPGADAIRAALIQPRWRPARVDALWEWLGTAAWFHHRGDLEAVAQMLAGAGEAERPLRWRIGEQRPDAPVDELVARLGELLDPHRFAIIPERRRAALVAETRLLLRTDEVAPLPWTALVEVATGSAEIGVTLEGPAGEVGEPSLCVLLAERKFTCRTLLRDVVLDPANVLRIGGLQDGFVAGQVAVQTERILRERSTTADQVRFLWNLLQQDPPDRTFAELGVVLRIEPGQPHPLEPMVRAVSTLDQRRDEHAGIGPIATAFTELVACVRVLLGGQLRVGAALDALAHAVEAAVAQASDPLDDPSWLDRLERVVIGADPHGEARGGLVGWAAWLGGIDDDALIESRLGTSEAMSRLRAAVRMVASVRPGVTAEQHEELVAAAEGLRGAVGTLGWPETRLLDSLLQRLEGRSQEALAVGRRSAAAVGALHRVLEKADEPAMGSLIRDGEQLDLLPVEELRRLHHHLLGQLLFADAAYLRRAVADRISLPTGTTHRMPLFAAVAGGTFLVLDVADQWLALPEKGAWGQTAATIAMALVASYGLLVADLGSRLQSPAATQSERWSTIAIRAVPTFLQASAVSVVGCALAMATLGLLDLDPTGLASLALWSALALFLGVFIGLVLQGESATGGGER